MTVVVIEASLKPNDDASSSSCTGVGGRCTDRQAAEAVDAEIGLIAFGDELLEAGLRAIAVENVIERLDRRLVGGAAGKQIAVAGLGIEQRRAIHRARTARFAAPRRAPLPLLTPLACTIADFTVLLMSIMLPSAVFIRLMRAITLSMVSS